MTSDTSFDLDANPMEWMAEGASLRSGEADSLAVVGAAARLAVFNHVRCAFEVEAHRGSMTRKRLAEALGVSSALVGRWLREPSNMTVETAAKLLFVMGREFRLASPQGERTDGIATPRDIRWIRHSPTPNAPLFNVSVLYDSAEVRCIAEPGEVSVSVFECDDGDEAWISGPGVRTVFFKAVASPREDMKRLVPFGTTAVKRETHVNA
jgi:transcriptional regulator with XRE-family HTH domain